MTAHREKASKSAAHVEILIKNGLRTFYCLACGMEVVSEGVSPRGRVTTCFSSTTT